MTAPIVLLHPLGADAAFWDPVLAELDSLDVTAVDLPGHGAAPALPEGTGIDGYSAAVAQRLAEFGQPVHLVGMSLGGLVAQQLGASRPDLLASVVLVDTVAVYPEAMREMWRDRARAAREGALASLVAPMVTMWFTDDLANADDDRVSQARKTFEATDAEGYARACDILADVDLRTEAASITAPTVVVCGEDDAPPFVAAAGWLVDAVDGAQARWLPGKHACAVEYPKEFAAVLRDVAR